MKRTIFMLMLLLMASPLVMSQSRNEDNLRGLKGVRLVVRFGRAEAMEKEQRPAVLKVLEDDARTKLQTAGIQLIQSADEMVKAGYPMLLITITLDQPNGFVYPLVTEITLMQRVRLARDPSIETDVPTWRRDGVGGPKLTVEMIRSQVASEIDQFITAYTAANHK